MRTMVAVAGMLALAGCAGLTPQEIKWQRQAIEAQDMTKCQQYGAGPGHQDYPACMLTLRQMREQRAIAEYQAQSQAAIANQAFGLQWYNAYAARQQSYAAPQFNCQTFDSGGGVMVSRCR